MLVAHAEFKELVAAMMVVRRVRVTFHDELIAMLDVYENVCVLFNNFFGTRRLKDVCFTNAGTVELCYDPVIALHGTI